MIYLLDVNLLVALAWPSHVHHAEAQQWFAKTGKTGWATCPLTQTGFIRISSNPRFIDGAVTPAEAIGLLREVSRSRGHHFWPDDVNLSSKLRMPLSHLVGHRQVTDFYLLSLVMRKEGRLATLDSRIHALLPPVEERATYIEVIPF